MSISWGTLAAIKVFTSDIMASVLIKSTADKGERPRRLVILYGLIMLLAYIGCLVTSSSTQINWGAPLIAFVGIFNAIACYSHWRAVAISHSKTALFIPASSVVSVILAVLLLGEAKIVTTESWIGIFLLFISAFVLASGKSKTNKKINFEFLFWIVIMTLLFSAVTVFMKYSASVIAVSRWSFSFEYYLGSAFGALGVFLFSRKEERGNKLGSQGWKETLPLAISIYVSHILIYWTLELAPLSIIAPLFRVSGLVFPFLIGQLYFNEKSDFTRKDWLGCLIAVLGVALIMLSA